ncbi:PQQ-binding-like beta-propeller repeat protein [Muricauda sp. MAR_2010_75]|uniref:outer membrane protein assembly factor BamB family protein n=1 Tax=Allomuricauda sp. MAR_2010_75 TaxID=1250232 RepID=UPI00068DA3DE|nr:PQQ-binding-like beta-propeller repeat protein [Muricauda sp. MAR_2010_75]
MKKKIIFIPSTVGDWQISFASIGPLVLLALVSLFTACTDYEKGTATINQHKTWRNYGGGNDQSKYTELSQINKSNVKDLEVAWFYPSGDNKIYQFNPIVVDTVMYVLAKNNSLVALNAKTGEEIWIHANLSRIARRGINYWESEDGKDKRLLFQINNYLQAIDATTGKSILTFGDNGLVDLRQGLDRDAKTLNRAQSGTPGQIFEDLILLGTGTGESYLSTPGFLRAYNVRTGELAWTFHTIPRPGEFGYDTWPKDAYKYVGGVNVWGEITVDAKNGIAFYPLGSPTFDYYGADRIGSNLYGNSLLALDARTGERLWHFQTVHHDIWDYDLTSAPQLLTVNHDGQEIEAVAVVGKNGLVYVFNRHTGDPLFPIEEKPVPPSHVEGEEAWPTQPIPTVLPPTTRLAVTEDDLSEVFLTKEERADWARKLRDSIQTGLFTPLSNKFETLAMPGAVGGVNWGNTAADPNKGILYIIALDYPSVYDKLLTLEQIEAKTANIGSFFGNARSYIQNCAACHGQEGEGLVGPALSNIQERMNLKDFTDIIVTGQGDMPAFTDLTSKQIEDLYEFLAEDGASRYSSQFGSSEESPTEGPVVASGGAPGGLEDRVLEGNPGRYGGPYPEGVEVEHERLYLYQWGLEFPYIISPPWSQIMAYDLNDGTVKWKRPLGQDLEALKKGFDNTGVLRAQRNGMIITSTGLVFSTSKDGRVYAFDAENGEELWKSKLPKGSEGLPAMYEVDGKQYLAVTAATPIKFGREGVPEEGEDPNAQGGYVVYALPD